MPDDVRVDVLAREAHFRAHARPIFDLLPPEHRGAFYERARDLPPGSRRPTLVSSFGDLRKARDAGRPVILMEHGAGQTYRDSSGRILGHTSYAGGRDRYGVILALVPGPTAANAYRETRSLHGAPIVEIGCPKLDAWHRAELELEASPLPIVAVSFHWECSIVLETKSAWRPFLPAVAALVRSPGPYRIVGHAHPRLRSTIEPIYAKHGIRFEPSFDRILATASVYACDNSSTMYEFASLGRPVVVLNHRIYRKDVEHGLRFWAASELGPHVDDPDDLDRAIRRALRPNAEAAARRANAVALAYTHVDGRATERAVRAILDVVSG